MKRISSVLLVLMLIIELLVPSFALAYSNKSPFQGWVFSAPRHQPFHMAFCIQHNECEYCHETKGLGVI
ncbi:MAG: hypothetical protein IKC28_06970 [Clostridia bacterium]|nr:hypothetical protein [Clostridia bacterium]